MPEHVNFDVWKTIDYLVDEMKAKDARIEELEGVPTKALPNFEAFVALNSKQPSTRETALGERVKYLEGVFRQIQPSVNQGGYTWQKCQDALYSRENDK